MSTMSVKPSPILLRSPFEQLANQRFSAKQTSENHFYSIRLPLYSPKELQIPPWKMIQIPAALE